MGGKVQLTVQTNKDTFPATGGQQLTYVLIEAMPTGVVADVKMPVNFSLVLDHSGSMSGAKLENLKEAAKLAVDQMCPQDLLSVVIFDDKVKVVAPSQPVSDGRGLKELIDDIRAGGGTAISRGMKEGLQELHKGVGSDRVSRMLLLTDGETFGDEDACRRLAADAGGAGIPIVALGLGEWAQSVYIWLH